MGLDVELGVVRRGSTSGSSLEKKSSLEEDDDDEGERLMSGEVSAWRLRRGGMKQPRSPMLWTLRNGNLRDFWDDDGPSIIVIIIAAAARAENHAAGASGSLSDVAVTGSVARSNDA